MARQRRYHQPGFFYHVMLRGNHRQDIFFTDRDRYNMCFLLQEGVEKFKHQIHSYCFMNNHIHLLVQVNEIPLSKIIQNLTFRYSQKINRKYKLTGHLFQGRFKAIILDGEAYFTRLLRYIHMNPVRANITDSPEKYRWSSHNAYLKKNSTTWLTTDFGLSRFNENNPVRDYNSYVLETESNEELEELRKNFKDSQVLGDDNFLNLVKKPNSNPAAPLLTLDRIVNAVCQEFNLEQELVICPGKSQRATLARAVISKIAVDTGKISINNLAKHFNRSPNTVSEILSNFLIKYNASSQLRQEVASIKEKAGRIRETDV